ncbi:hypothetical protein AALO_G00119990 [Alosa alosa]|uniref:Uncharacterized protein n=1 Tax=Alosa alosa TaxID=278164 RepID=A0AAV6GRF9_9TELE|nr:hypothetical protein AALO_G00119990 [Alosa alosa]
MAGVRPAAATAQDERCRQEKWDKHSHHSLMSQQVKLPFFKPSHCISTLRRASGGPRGPGGRLLKKTPHKPRPRPNPDHVQTQTTSKPRPRPNPAHIQTQATSNPRPPPLNGPVGSLPAATLSLYHQLHWHQCLLDAGLGNQ